LLLRRISFYIHKQVTKELIGRFFRKECTPEEAEEVAAYLKANPSVLEEYLSAEEWNMIVADNNVSSDDFWKETWQNIRRTNRNKDVVRKIKRVAAVASVMVLVSAALYYSLYNSGEIKTTVAAKTPVNKVQEQERKTVTNDTKKMLRVLLDDNSVVELSPASSIQYELPFGKMKRDILLEGKARFSVTKNKAKPFTVYAGTFTTTALGTVFTVQNNKAGKTFTVRLFEGKVVIHSINNNVSGWQQDVYLLPGEQLEFNKLSGTLVVNKTARQKPAIAVVPEKHTVDSTNNRLNFSNASLPEVMRTLAGWYSISIVYDSSLISKMNFTGVVSHNDSPGIILKVIAQTNGLEVSKNDTAFIIYKP
jgi:transmembrane sensor